VTDLRSYLLHNELRLGTHLFTAALERKEDHLQNAPIDRGRSQDALALGYGWKSGPHAVQLNVRHDDDSEFGAKNTGSAGYGFAITPQWRVTASTATAFPCAHAVPPLQHLWCFHAPA
jgi:vitamin B12 transporter